MTKNIIKLLILAIFIILPLARPEITQARGTGLKISPSLLQIKAEAPTEINAPLIIENLDDSVADLNIQLKLFLPSNKDNGQVEYVLDKDNHSDIFSKAEIIDNGITINELRLGPRQKKDLDLRIKIPDNYQPADYYFSVVFVSKPNISTQQPGGISSRTIISGGVAMNVLLSVGPTTQPLANIEKFTAPSFVEKGPIPFTIKIQNKTSQYIKPKGIIYIKNMFGQLIGKVDIPATNILTGSSRYLTNQFALQKNKSLGESAVVWPEKFLLGFYTAHVNIELADKGPVLTDTIKFVALPLGLIIFIILGALTFIIIFKRVKSKM